MFHFCISEFCSGSCQRERKTLNIAASEPWFLPFSALRSKNSYSLYFVRSWLAVLICHIISASVSNESSSQTVHDQILFFFFFCSLFLVLQMVNLFSIGASVIYYLIFFICVYIYVCLHACTDFPVSSLLGNLSPDWWVFLTVIFTWAMFSPSSLHTGMSEVTSVGETHRELKLTVIPSETRHLRPAINKPSTDSTFFNVALQTVQTSHSH